ncbi:LytTR family transcriptional regulator [Leucothrix sargassi]|nr:LytTR family transcriptional regulator [Leucothrix sargassi]
MTLILKSNFLKFEEFWIIVLSLLMAWTLAAHQDAHYPIFGVLGSYLYWTFRILIEVGLFVAALFAIEKYFSHLVPTWACYAAAILCSLVPFTLAITALDIIIGLPELGINSEEQATHSRAWAFCLELFYLLDNHITLTLILLLPRFLMKTQHALPTEPHPETITTTQANFFETLDPPLEGRVYCMEAQEHYIAICAEAGDRMVLHRFSDAVKQLPKTLGLQVHRSHWVALDAVEEVIISGQTMKLQMANGKQVPVSRTFRTAVEAMLKK